MIRQLDLFTPSAKPSSPDPLDVAQFIQFLRGNGWKKAAEIATETGWSDRQCRLFAAASNGHVISGQKGYKLTLECTPIEFGNFEAFFRSQIREMSTRLRAAERLYHRPPNGTR